MESRWGITVPVDGLSLDRHRALWAELEELGYSDFWTLETGAFDAFTPLALAAGATTSVRLGTAIASVFSRGPGLLAMNAAALAQAAPGRFVLGIGSSSPALVEGWNAVRFERPVERLRDTLRFLRQALAGERVDHAFETFAVRGFRLDRPPEVPPPIYVAALRERMLRLAGREGDGVLLGLLSSDDVRRVVSVARQERTSSEAWDVVLRLGVYPSEDAAAARMACRRILATYLNAPPYARFHTWLGRGRDLEPLQAAWKARDRQAAMAAVPDEWVDAFFIHGSPEACREQVRGFVEAGVTTPVLQIMWTGEDPMRWARALAPAPNRRTSSRSPA